MSKWDEFTWDEFTWDSPDVPPSPGKQGKHMRNALMTFSALSEVDFASRGQAVVAGMGSVAGLAFFAAPWFADPAKPTLVTLTAKVEAYVAAKNAAEDGDKAKIAARNALRAELTADLKEVARYVNYTANGDVEMLEASGFELTKEPAPRTTQPPGQPQSLKLKHGAQAHSLVASCAKVPGAQSYEVQRCAGDPNVDGNWQLALVSTSCRNIEITGLTGGTIYAVRVRAINKNGPGAWSDIASLMAM